MFQPHRSPLSADCFTIACRVMGEWLGHYIVETIEEAQDQATEWLWTYNNERPNIPFFVSKKTIAEGRGIGGITLAMKLKTAA